MALANQIKKLWRDLIAVVKGRLTQLHDSRIVACSSCFRNSGLRIAANALGRRSTSSCQVCGNKDGGKLSRGRMGELAHRFFVWGSMQRGNYGAAPLVQFNEHQQTSIEVDSSLSDDVRIFERVLGVGFFYYGPRLWMLGEIEPLKALQLKEERDAVFERILNEYPKVELPTSQEFYRIRTFPSAAMKASEYDSPPPELAGQGRLDTLGAPVLYGSTDLEVCLHECRVGSEDDIYVATLRPLRKLKLLDLSALLEEDGTEFESLDLAVQMLFFAGKHSYLHTRALATAVREAGFDGVFYPSYFSLLRTGAMPFETVYGISVRRFPGARTREQWKTVPNIALFGRPLAEGKVAISSINRLVLRRVGYGFELGPAFDLDDERTAGKKQMEALKSKLNSGMTSAGLELTEADFDEIFANVQFDKKP